MLELSWRGANEIPLADGQSRKFLKDGDATRWHQKTISNVLPFQAILTVFYVFEVPKYILY